MKKGRLGGFRRGVPDAPDAPVLLQTVPVACLPLPASPSARLAETSAAAMPGRRRRRGGAGEISGAQALPVKSDVTF